eukprot:m.154571 g.154571  ORF g.154571 m.154571 type:complete len:80 (+) comp15084_c0_seq8:186-425(+)
MSASESNQIADIKRFEASCKDILRELRQEGSSVHRSRYSCLKRKILTWRIKISTSNMLHRIWIIHKYHWGDCLFGRAKR